VRVSKNKKYHYPDFILIKGGIFRWQEKICMKLKRKSLNSIMFKKSPNITDPPLNISSR
jgi:hypothetical protein